MAGGRGRLPLSRRLVIESKLILILKFCSLQFLPLQKWRSVDKGTLHNFSNIVCLIVAIICLVVPWAALSCIDHVVVPWSKCCGNVMWMSKNLKSGCCGSIAFLYRAPCRANKIYKKIIWFLSMLQLSWYVNIFF